jgi:hypothetical protein
MPQITIEYQGYELETYHVKFEIKENGKAKITNVNDAPLSYLPEIVECFLYDKVDEFIKSWDILETPDSSNLSQMEFNHETKILVVQFKTGSRYSYSEVDPGIWELMKKAESKGRFYVSNIKNKYQSTKL